MLMCLFSLLCLKFKNRQFPFTVPMVAGVPPTGLDGLVANGKNHYHYHKYYDSNSFIARNSVVGLLSPSCVYALGVGCDADIMQNLLDVVRFEPLPQHVLRQSLYPLTKRLTFFLFVFLLHSFLFFV